MFRLTLILEALIKMHYDGAALHGFYRTNDRRIGVFGALDKLGNDMIGVSAATYISNKVHIGAKVGLQNGDHIPHKGLFEILQLKYFLTPNLMTDIEGKFSPHNASVKAGVEYAVTKDLSTFVDFETEKKSSVFAGIKFYFDNVGGAASLEKKHERFNNPDLLPLDVLVEAGTVLQTQKQEQAAEELRLSNIVNVNNNGGNNNNNGGGADPGAGGGLGGVAGGVGGSGGAGGGSDGGGDPGI